MSQGRAEELVGGKQRGFEQHNQQAAARQPCASTLHSAPWLSPHCSCTHCPPFCSIPTDVSFGLIGSTGVVSAAQERTPQYALLAAPTPGRENSGPRPGGPLIVGCV